MNDNEIEFPEDERIDSEAAEWVAKRVRGFTAKEQDAFFEWLADDPRHSEWYTRHMKTWKQLDQLAQWKPEHSKRPNQDLLKYHMTRSRWAWLGGIAAALAMTEAGVKTALQRARAVLRACITRKTTCETTTTCSTRS